MDPDSRPADSPPPTPQSPPKEDHFIPVDLERVVEDLLALVEREGGPVDDHAALYRSYVGLFQLELAERLKELKTAYHPYDPDAETIAARAAPAAGPRVLEELCAALRRVLERANFRELSREDVERALNKTSPRGLEVHVDLDEFEVISLWARGECLRPDEHRSWRRGYVRKEVVSTPIHRRVCVFGKLREDGQSPGPSGAAPPPVDGPPPAPHEDYEFARDDADLRHDCLYVKLFRDIAHSDLEMMLPNSRVRMTLPDKLKLGITGGGGTIGGLTATLTKIGVATNPITWGFALVGFGGVVWRQVAKLFHQRVRYLAALARKLYCRNLDNNFGAITRLVELAEEEECKEALLAWTFLSRHGAEGVDLEQLDREIEGHVRETYGVESDFEVRDGVGKLRQHALLAERRDERVEALPLSESRARLARAWAERLGVSPGSGAPTAP